MKIKKYEGGIKGIFKKQKAKEDEAATELAKIDVADSQEVSTKKMKFKGLDSIDSSFEAPTPKQSIAKVEAPAKLASYSNEVSKAKTIKLNDAPDRKKQEMDAVKAWQSKRGLKADGIWGKDTQAAYEKEQAAKKSTPKKMTIGKNYSKLEIPEVKLNDGSTGKRDAIGNTYYKNDRVVGKDYKANINSTTVKAVNEYEKSPVRKGAKKPAVIKNSTTSAPKSQPKESKEQQVQRLMDTSRLVEQQGGQFSPEQVKIAKEIQKGESKDDAKTMNLGSKIGLGVAGTAALSLGVGIAKGKVNRKSLSTVANKAKDVVSSGISKAKSMTKSTPKKMNINTPVTSSISRHDTSPEAVARRAREAAAKQNNQRAAIASQNRNTMKPRGEYMTEEQRAEFKKSLHSTPTNVETKVNKEVKSPTVKTFTSPTTKTVSAPETKTVKSKGFESKVSGDKFKKKVK